APRRQPRARHRAPAPVPRRLRAVRHRQRARPADRPPSADEPPGRGGESDAVLLARALRAAGKVELRRREYSAECPSHSQRHDQGTKHYRGKPESEYCCCKQPIAGHKRDHYQRRIYRRREDHIENGGDPISYGTSLKSELATVCDVISVEWP